MISQIWHQELRQQKKTDKLDTIEMKNFYGSKKTIKRVKRHLIEWEKYLQIASMIKVLYPEYTKTETQQQKVVCFCILELYYNCLLVLSWVWGFFANSLGCST